MVSDIHIATSAAQEDDFIEQSKNVALGIEVLHGDNDEDDIAFDIIAVPGLGTDPVECWNWPARKRKTSEEQKQSTKIDPFNWLVDANGLHTEQDRARIMLYKYTSAWKDPFKVSNSLEYLAKALLIGLSTRRKTDSEKERPIILIGHSMGGLVIAKALCLADLEPAKFPDIIPYVTGCYFFGTPFKGSDLFKLAVMHNGLRKYLYDEDNYIKLLELMTPGNNDLGTLSSDFRTLARRMQPEIKLYCFYEQWSYKWPNTIEEMMGGPVADQVKEAAAKLQQKKDLKFVTQDSAVLPEVEPMGLNADHSGLVRFQGAKDPGFHQIMGYINDVASNAVYTVRLRANTRHMDDFQVAHIRNLLKSGVDMRVTLEKSPKISEEDRWLVEQLTFKQWRQPSKNPRSCLWIDGPPGYGKTTASVAVTRYIESRILKQRGKHHSQKLKTLWACFFCDSQQLCCTAEDVLKSILLQLIEQYSNLAVYAKIFLDKDNQKLDSFAEKRNNQSNAKFPESKTYNQGKATMTIEHLWECLMDMLKDISLDTVYIIVNNIHRLDQNESLQKLLNLISSDVTRGKSVQDGTLLTRRDRWFITSFSKSRPDIQNVMRHEDVLANVCQMDLQDTEYKTNVDKALTNHVRSKAHNLSKARGYDRGLEFELEKIVESKAQNKKWVDIIFLQLEALPENCSRLVIKDRLNAAACGDLPRLVEGAWQWVFDGMQAEFKSKVKDVLRALVLLAENVTLEELAVLTGYSAKDLKPFIDACAPLLLFDKADQRIVFVDDLIKDFLLSDWATLLTSSASDASQEEVKSQIEWQHGYLTWNCFTHLDKALSPDGIPRLTRVATLACEKAAELGQQSAHTKTPVQDTDKSDQQNHTDTPASPLAYPLKCWKHHAAAGGRHMAQSLCTDMSGFWEEESFLRQIWLRCYVNLNLSSEFVDLNIEHMTALHVTSALGLFGLSSALLEIDHENKMQALDGNQYTPLHLAALNNHSDVVELLLRKGAEVDASQTVASPLHLAAVRGNVNIMRKLLETKPKNVANANATCEQYGPVINASIQSGVSDAVIELLKHEHLDLRTSGVEPPLVLSARISKSSLFQELLEEGKDIWEEKHYEAAMVEASYRGRIECVEALMKCGHDFTKNCLKMSVIKAGVWDNWEVATALLKHENFGKNPNDYYDIFFLAAATTSVQDQLLEKIEELAQHTIPQEILDAALYHATDNQKPTTVTWLLEHCKAGANARSKKPAALHEGCFEKLNTDSYGDALTAAAFDDSYDIVQTLLENNAKVDSKFGAALQIAAKQGNLNIVNLLLDRGAEINRIIDEKLMLELHMNDFPGTALQIACDFNKPEVVKRLLERGADPNLSHPESRFTRPIISATQNKRADILTYLLEVESTEVNVQGGKKHNFPLQSACEDMKLESVEQLLARGANINVVDSKGNQAIHMAASHGNTDVLKFLLAKNADVTHYSQEKGLALQEALKQKHLDCGELLADAITPILKALVTAASHNNKFARSLIENPRGEHPHIDTEKFEHLLKENAALTERNHYIELILNDYKAMEKRVEEHQKIATRKQQIAENAWAELEETHRRYDCSIEGYEAVNRHRNSLLEELKQVRAAKTREHETEVARLENEVISLGQQLQAKDEELEKEQDKSASGQNVLQHALQCEKMRADQLEAYVWELTGGNRVLTTNESVSSLAVYDVPTNESSTRSLSWTEPEPLKSSRFSFSVNSDESDQLYSTATGSTTDIDQAKPVSSPIKRKKVRVPLIKMASDLNLAGMDKWKTMADATQTQVVSASLSAKTAIEDWAVKAKSLHRKSSNQ